MLLCSKNILTEICSIFRLHFQAVKFEQQHRTIKINATKKRRRREDTQINEPSTIVKIKY